MTAPTLRPYLPADPPGIVHHHAYSRVLPAR